METDAEYGDRMRYQYQRADDELRRLQSALDQACGLSESEYEELQRKVTSQRALVNEIGECLR